MPDLHALLSPSSAHRWMNCPSAPRLEAAVEDSGSDYTREGTLAHAYCAKKLKTVLGLDTAAENAEIAELNGQYYSGEMDEYTDAYTAIVLEKYSLAKRKIRDAQLLVESRLDFGSYVPESFGTSDAIIIADGVMEVIDFKYGKGVRVSAVGNEQMRIYALGAYLSYYFEYRIDRVRMTIVQPRLDNLSEDEMSASDLIRWAETELRPKAAAAFSTDGAQVPGDWCRFCKVKSRCRALAAQCVDASKRNPDPRLLSAEELARHVLPVLDTVKSWVSGIEEYALQSALDGVSYPGYKVVAGRSVRRITDTEAVKAILAKEGYHESEYMKPATLAGISDIEKMMGKKRFADVCSAYIIKPQGKPTLVTDDDKRPAYNAVADDFSNIEV